MVSNLRALEAYNSLHSLRTFTGHVENGHVGEDYIDYCIPDSCQDGQRARWQRRAASILHQKAGAKPHRIGGNVAIFEYWMKIKTAIDYFNCVGWTF
jgi:hypothetical protein